MPLRGGVDHGVGHLTLGVLLLLLFLLAMRWPALAPGRAAHAVRIMLLLGLAFFGIGTVVEAIGPFGYEDDGLGAVNNLAALHDFGVLIGPLGLVLTMAGTVMSVGALLAGRRDVAGTRLFTLSVALAVVAVAAFVIGALVFGY